MLTIQQNLAEKKRSIAMLFTAFVVATALLFTAMTFAVLIPKISAVLETMSYKANRTTASIFAEKLERHLLNREVALSDVAAMAEVVNTARLADNQKPVFLDLIQQTTLLGEDPSFTAVDA